jgi:phage terminase Nu1 subunit (DNA packaging protein)
MEQLSLDSLTAVQVAELLGVTDRAVRKWVKTKGLPCIAGSGVMTFAWPSVRQWWTDVARAGGGTGGTSGKKAATDEQTAPPETYEEALSRKTRAEADLKELQLAKERGQVASIADVERVISAATIVTRTQILAVPSRLASRLLGMDDYKRVVTILESEMRQLLTNLATIDAVREADAIERRRGRQ